MFDLINRIRNFDVRKVTPVQWVMVVIGVIVALWVLNTLISIAISLMPVVVIGVVVFLAYRVLSSRAEDTRDIQQEKREENIQQAASSTQRAAQQVNTVMATKVDKVEDSTRLSADAAVNPATGFTEVDLTRLAEKEETILKQSQPDADEVARQLEERRKRLLGGQ
jgi:uncharacterized membrane protein